ncbi:hypothetical protein PR048_025719 [Dryococelus australis]|uniref:Uncharacterized protein n=1 Tax=Dryococelus australis TaxID=614101 RepID=A0ABQ9GJB4_9NEOP|nr:hypothetical protein PR048_025719 [Dryococelus australis]
MSTDDCSHIVTVYSSSSIASFKWWGFPARYNSCVGEADIERTKDKEKLCYIRQCSAAVVSLGSNVRICRNIQSRIRPVLFKSNGAWRIASIVEFRQTTSGVRSRMYLRAQQVASPEGELIPGSATRGTLRLLSVERVAAVPHTGVTAVVGELSCYMTMYRRWPHVAPPSFDFVLCNLLCTQLKGGYHFEDGPGFPKSGAIVFDENELDGGSRLFALGGCGEGGGVKKCTLTAWKTDADADEDDPAQALVHRRSQHAFHGHSERAVCSGRGRGSRAAGWRLSPGRRGRPHRRRRRRRRRLLPALVTLPFSSAGAVCAAAASPRLEACFPREALVPGGQRVPSITFALPPRSISPASACAANPLDQSRQQ